MKSKYLSIIAVLFVTLVVTSCKKMPEGDYLYGDKDKIDIKGSLMNGDMKNPNIEATFSEKTLCVKFYDDLGECIISVSDKLDSVVFCDTVQTYYDASYRYYMGDQPLGRYRLHITNGIHGAEGWFYNYRIVAVSAYN